MKNIIVITGGAGFVGANLISFFLKNTKYKILSIDNYSSGLKINHIKNKKVKYIKGNTKNISTLLNSKKNKIDPTLSYLLHLENKMYEAKIEISKKNFNQYGKKLKWS